MNIEKNKTGEITFINFVRLQAINLLYYRIFHSYMQIVGQNVFSGVRGVREDSLAVLVLLLRKSFIDTTPLVARPFQPRVVPCGEKNSSEARNTVSSGYGEHSIGFLASSHAVEEIQLTRNRLWCSFAREASPGHDVPGVLREWREEKKLSVCGWFTSEHERTIEICLKKSRRI